MEYLPLFPLLFAFISTSVGYALLAFPGTWRLMFQMVIITHVLRKRWLFSVGDLRKLSHDYCWFALVDKCHCLRIDRWRNA